MMLFVGFLGLVIIFFEFLWICIDFVWFLLFGLLLGVFDDLEVIYVEDLVDFVWDLEIIFEELWFKVFFFVIVVVGRG